MKTYRVLFSTLVIAMVLTIYLKDNVYDFAQSLHLLKVSFVNKSNILASDIIQTFPVFKSLENHLILIMSLLNHI